MPAGSRVRANNVYGTVSDNPLLIGATSFTSLGLNELPAISGQHAVIVLDPKRLFGPDPEIVVVTSHLAMGTTATITRGAYGTAAREHPQGTPWAHVPVGPDDYTAIVTSGTRPSDPYAGQMIFETDTDKFVARIAANSAWQDAVPLGAWQTWTPVFTNFTLGAGTAVARYTRSGRQITWYLKVTLSGSTMGSAPTFTLPVAMAPSYGQILLDYMGTGWLQDAGTGHFGGFVNWATSTTVSLNVWTASGAFIQASGITVSNPFTWANGDSFTYQGTYESAT